MKIIIYFFLAVSLISASFGINERRSLRRLENELDAYLAKNYSGIKANYKEDALERILFSCNSGNFSDKERLDLVLNPFVRDHYMKMMCIRMNGWNFFAITIVFTILSIFVLGLDYILEDVKSKN